MFVNKHVSLCDTDVKDVWAVVSLFEAAGRLLGMSSNTSVAVRQRGMQQKGRTRARQ